MDNEIINIFKLFYNKLIPINIIVYIERKLSHIIDLNSIGLYNGEVEHSNRTIYENVIDKLQEYENYILSSKNEKYKIYILDNLNKIIMDFKSYFK